MKSNPLRLLFSGGAGGDRPVLLQVTPPRTGERTMLGVESMLSAIAVPEPFSLELAGGPGGVTLMARCLRDRAVRSQLAVRYPQGRIHEIPQEDDPLRLAAGEQAWVTGLRSGGPEYVPLRTFQDGSRQDPGSDPLIALMGALSGLNRGERVVARLLLRSLGPDWSEAHRARAFKRPFGESTDPAYTYETRPLQLDGVTMAVLGAAALAAVKGYQWVQDGEAWKAVLLGLGTALSLGVGGLVWQRWKRSREHVHDPLLIREKIARMAFEAEMQMVVVLPQGTRAQRFDEVVAPVLAAYRHFDNPAGARFIVSKPQRVTPSPDLHPRGPGLFGTRSVLGVQEVAALWHPPGAADEVLEVARAGARVLPPAAGTLTEGVHVGDTNTATPRMVHFPADLLHRHHLFVARTRMGKSTLMQHLVTHKLREKAAGRDGDAIVVVDPHADLVNALLEQVPEEIASSVRLIDLADDRRVPGINLLDTRVFADRDRTADAFVRVARGLWEQWGPRMQSILEQTVKSLHEANERREEDEQYTILDGLRLLADERFRAKVLAKVDDSYLLEWWARDFGNWRREYQAEALAPVQTRLNYYATSKRARAILGQPRSTIDLRRTILDGGVLLVSTALGVAGRDVSALVGASLLNLVDAVVREQGTLPHHRRRGVLIVVDEMQTMPGVDYEGMLSELGKFGASLVLATQSLAKLDDLSRTMRDTLLANVGCLTVFQVAAEDARLLVRELGKDPLDENDVISQAVHHCYVRATVDGERLPAFSMQVRPPEPGSTETAARIRRAAEDYTRSAAEVADRQAGLRRLVDQYHDGLDDLEREAPGQPSEDLPPAPEGQPRNKVRTKHEPNGQAGAGESAPDEATGDALLEEEVGE